MLAKYDAQNPIALNRILEQGIQMRPFAQDIMSKAFEVAQQLLSDNAQKDPEYAKIYESWQIRKQMFQWFDKAESAYAQFAFLNYNFIIDLYCQASPSNLFVMFIKSGALFSSTSWFTINRKWQSQGFTFFTQDHWDVHALRYDFL